MAEPELLILAEWGRRRIEMAELNVEGHRDSTTHIRTLAYTAVIAALVLSTGCSGSTTKAPAESERASAHAAPDPAPARDATADSPTLAQQIIAAGHDMPVVITAGFGGMAARTSDGVIMELLPRSIRAAWLDPRRELIWVISWHSLDVVDLREEEFRTVEIIDGVSDHGVYIGGDVNVFVGSRTGGFLEVDWTDTPSLRVGGTFPNEWESDRAKRARLVGRDWLIAQRDRPLIEVPQAAITRVEVEGVTCDDPAACFQAAPIGDTGTHLVVVEHDCDDGCRSWCYVVDDATGNVAPTYELANPTWSPRLDKVPRTSRCGTFYLDVSQRWLGVGQYLCELGGDCQNLGQTVRGFLPPGQVLSLPVSK